MPTLKDRVDTLENHAKNTDEKISDLRGEVTDLQEWTQEEERLRQLDGDRIKALEEARGIHDRRLRRIQSRLDARTKRRK